MTIIVGASLHSCAQERHIPMNEGWMFHGKGQERSYPAMVPGVVHTDLMRNGLIPDPYRHDNVDSVQWIEHTEWVYTRSFTASDTLLRHEHIDLVFKGLDTFADVYLNDSLLGRADNMFRTWEWAIKPLIREGRNELTVIFRSPITEGTELRDAYGIQLPHDSDPSGVSPYIRKAAYQFGWDFCPRLVTCGIWKEVELRCWSDARIGDLHYWSSPGAAGQLVVFPDIRTGRNHVPSGACEVWYDDSLIARTKIPDAMKAPLTVELPTKGMALWWPHGTGDRPVHEVKVVLKRGGKTLSEARRSHAFRTIEWDLEADGDGSAFRCIVNGEPLFMKGCNLVPPDMFLPRAGDSAWVSQVRLMQAAGMNMVRVWSGGVYPPDAFYQACDTAGILVWQDLMLASLVPAEGAMLFNIQLEVQEQLERIMNRPCLALVCGNNELRVAWKHWGWQDRYGIHGPDSIRVITSNERLWSEDLRYLTVGLGHLAYTPTSPLSNWGNAAGLRSGDLHYWGVWHGDSTFASFGRNVGRFVSEYGFQSYPDSSLLSRYVEPPDLYLGSPAVERMQRSYKTDRPIWEAIERETEHKPTTFGQFIAASQEAQALAYRIAAEAHMSAQPRCMGTLLWQLNDCWPGPSWSIVDYEGRPKPAYRIIRDVYTRP